MNRQINILLVDDEEPIREAMLLLLKASDYQTSACASGEEALELLAREHFDIVITDLFLPDITGIDILTKAKGLFPSIEVILITGHASAETAVRAMKEGAFDYITKPLNFEELKVIIAKAVEKQRLLNENVYLRKQLREKYEFSNIIGNSPAMQKVFSRITKIIKTDSTVLILGESGTGKELIAKAIHSNGPRRDKPFIAVHCGAIPENLLESELFGHTKGAFTGAIRDKMGKFEAANLGTIFLDEIGTLPPLRDRVEDILPLVRHFLAKYCAAMGRAPMNVSKEALMALEQYNWPGNVRELENMVERTVALTEGESIALDDLPQNIVRLFGEHEELSTRITSRGIDMVKVMNEMERKMINDALSLSDGVKARAAALLKLNRTTLVEKMRRLGMEG